MVIIVIGEVDLVLGILSYCWIVVKGEVDIEKIIIIFGEVDIEVLIVSGDDDVPMVIIVIGEVEVEVVLIGILSYCWIV